MGITGLLGGVVGLLVHTAVAIGLAYWARRALAERLTLQRVALACVALAFFAVPIGLFITIMQLVDAFGAVAHAEASERAALLSASISNAMTATAIGMVATMIGYGGAIGLCAFGTITARKNASPP